LVKVYQNAISLYDLTIETAEVIIPADCDFLESKSSSKLSSNESSYGVKLNRLWGWVGVLRGVARLRRGASGDSC